MKRKKAMFVLVMLALIVSFSFSYAADSGKSRRELRQEYRAAAKAAKEEFWKTIPTCVSGPDCQAKIAKAKYWLESNFNTDLKRVGKDFAILYSRGDIMAQETHHVAVSLKDRDDNKKSIIIEIYDLDLALRPDSKETWDYKLDFNRTLNKPL